MLEQLSTPAQHDYRNPGVELREKHVRQWVEKLPVLNHARSAPELLQVLAPLNQERIPAKQRFGLLEIYRQPVSTILESFDEVRLRQAPLTREMRARVRDSVGRLCLELANGYKILVCEAAASRIDPRKDAWLIPSVSHAMTLLASAALQAWRGYTAVPKQVFLEIHQIYRFAAANGLATQAPTKGQPTLQQQYIRFCLLSMSDPFHLPEGGAMVMHDLLGRFTRYCELQEQRPATGKQIYVVQSNSDSAPRPMAPAEPVSPDGSVLYLSLDNLLTGLKQLVDQPETTENPDEQHGTDQRYAALMLKALGLRERAHSRIAGERDLFVAAGLEAVWRSLAGDDAIADVSSFSESLVLEGEDSNEPVPADRQKRTQFGLWKIVNESIRGYLLASPDEPATMTPGQLLGLSPREDSPDIKLAQVRWMRQTRSGGTEIGVEIIPGQPTPVRFHHEGQPVRNGLLLPAVKALNIPASLICAADTCKLRTHMIMKVGDREVTALCRSVVEKTGVWDRLEIVATRKA